MDHVVPINLTLHSLFTEVEFKLNDTLVGSINSVYPFRAYLKTLLMYGADAKKSQLTAAMYCKDTPNHMDDGDPMLPMHQTRGWSSDIRSSARVKPQSC